MAIVLSTPPYQQFYDADGNPLSGGLVYTYAAGTTTPLATYTDQSGDTEAANPVILDSAGRAEFWLDSTNSYKFVVKDSLDNTIRTVDNVAPFVTGSGLDALGNIAAETIIGNNTGSSTTPLALTVAQTQTLLGIGGVVKNAVINGDFSIWQRATTYALTTTVAYGAADRFAANMATSAAGTFARSTDVPSGLGFTYSAKIGRTAASALTGNISLVQAIETSVSKALAGRTITLSFYVKAGADFSGSGFNYFLRTGTGTDESAASVIAGTWTGQSGVISGGTTLTTTWTRITVTTSVSSSVTQMAIHFRYTPSGTAGADDNMYITGVKIEDGSTATPFEFRGFATEFGLCERHYAKSFVYATAPAQNVGTGTGEFRFNAGRAGANPEFGYLYFRRRMFTAPTITLYNPAAANAQVRDITSAADCSASTTGNLTDNGFQIQATGNASTIVGGVLGAHWTAEAEL